MTIKELFVNINRFKLKHGSLVEIHVCEKMSQETGKLLRSCSSLCKHFPNTPAQFARLDYHSGVTASRETKFCWRLLFTTHLTFKKFAEFSFTDFFFLAQWCRLLPLSLFTLSISYSVLCAYVLSVEDG